MSNILDPNRVPGAYHLADNPELFEPQRQNNFELQITGLEDLRSVDLTLLDQEAYIANGSDIIRLTVESTSVPSFQQNEIQIQYGNNIVKYAGTPTFNTADIKVRDFIGVDTKGVLQAWQSKSYDVKTQKVGRAKDYKKTAYLIEYTPDYEVVRSWKIVGCWISNLTYDEFNYNQAEKKAMSATISFDYAIPEKYSEV